MGRDHSRIRFATVERDRPEASEVLGDLQLLSLANFGDGREQADYISISTEEACLKGHDAPHRRDVAWIIPGAFQEGS